jgi:hypothetical protein
MYMKSGSSVVPHVVILLSNDCAEIVGDIISSLKTETCILK